MGKTAPKRIVLGSGKLYVQTFTNAVPDDIETICTEENQLGYISGGATLEYTPEFYEAKDDLGVVIKSIITGEEVLLKSGVMTFNGNTLQKLCSTARVTEDPIKQQRVVKIGGIGNRNDSKYIIVFKHEDKIDGDIYVVIVGQNQSGFSLAFAKDAETVIDVEFKALAQDEEGTLIQYIEKDQSIVGE